MPQITQLDNDPTPNNNDLLVTVDIGAGTTKNISREQFFTGAPLPADTVDEQAIADGAVKKGKIDFNSGVWWEEIGRTEINSASATINVTLSASKRVLHIIVCTVGAGGTVRQGLRFNGDATNNYATRTSTDGGTDQTNASQNNITLDPGASADNVLSNVYAATRSDGSYWFMDYTSVNAAGVNATSVPTRRVGVGKWITASPITSINLMNNGGTGTFGAGSYIIVLGHD